MSFLIEDDDLLNKYNTIWDKVSTAIKKNLIANLSIIIFFENQVKSYGDETADFHDKEVPKVGSNYNSVAVISLDSVLKKDGNYYLQPFFKE